MAERRKRDPADGVMFKNGEKYYNMLLDGMNIKDIAKKFKKNQSYVSMTISKYLKNRKKEYFPNISSPPREPYSTNEMDYASGKGMRNPYLFCEMMGLKGDGICVGDVKKKVTNKLI